VADINFTTGSYDVLEAAIRRGEVRIPPPLCTFIYFLCLFFFSFCSIFLKLTKPYDFSLPLIIIILKLFYFIIDINSISFFKYILLYILHNIYLQAARYLDLILYKKRILEYLDRENSWRHSFLSWRESRMMRAYDYWNSKCLALSMEGLTAKKVCLSLSIPPPLSSPLTLPLTIIHD
jgi:hypothetical protein